MFGRNSWVPLILERSSAPDQMAPFEAGDSCDWTSLSRLLSFPAGINDALTGVWCKKELRNLPPALRNIPVETAPPTEIHRLLLPVSYYTTNSCRVKVEHVDIRKEPLSADNLDEGQMIFTYLEQPPMELWLQQPYFCMDTSSGIICIWRPTNINSVLDLWTMSA